MWARVLGTLNFIGIVRVIRDMKFHYEYTEFPITRSFYVRCASEFIIIIIIIIITIICKRGNIFTGTRPNFHPVFHLLNRLPAVYCVPAWRFGAQAGNL